MQGVMEHAVLQIARQMEDDIDQKLHSLDNMGEDDLERVRQARMSVRALLARAFSRRPRPPAILPVLVLHDSGRRERLACEVVHKLQAAAQADPVCAEGAVDATVG